MSDSIPAYLISGCYNGYIYVPKKFVLTYHEGKVTNFTERLSDFETKVENASRREVAIPRQTANFILDTGRKMNGLHEAQRYAGSSVSKQIDERLGKVQARLERTGARLMELVEREMQYESNITKTVEELRTLSDEDLLKTLGN